MKSVLALVFCASSVTTALAAPGFELIDRGDAVEIVAHDVKAASTAVRAARTRLEVEIVGATHIKPLIPADKAVKVVEIDGFPRALSVKLALDRPAVAAMARYAQAIQVGNDLHLLFPRALPADGATVKLPEPTLPAHLAKQLEASPPPSLIGPPRPEVKKEPAKAEVAKPEPAPVPEKPKSEPLSSVTKEEPAGSRAMTYALMGLAVIGLVAWVLKKKKTSQQAPTAIDVIAQRSLGAKAKVVWLAAGSREMVVAVTPQSVRMLGQWKKGEGGNGMSIPLPTAQALEPRFADKKAESKQTSPVAGILKLREHARITQNVARLEDDLANTDLDADALWAKEIIAATTNNGGRR